MRIDQVLVGASPGDAITNFARQLRQVLGPEFRSELFARFFDPALGGVVKPLSAYQGRDGPGPDDLLVYHVSIGEPSVADLVMARPERLVVIYHNISPSEPFRPFDPAFADLLDRGRAELAALSSRAFAALAESSFNAEELRAVGFGDVEVIPLIVELDGLLATPSDPAVAERLRTQSRGPVVVAVGQLLPHKRIDFLVEAFHVLATYLEPDAELFLVGPPRLDPYARAIRAQIDELHLERAHVTGAVPLPELLAILRRADILVSASEHEGFCVPLLEAMSLELPFQARRFGAIPETAGPAGLLLDPSDGPAVAAEAWVTILSDQALRVGLVARGRRRLADFDPDSTRQAWRRALTDLARS